METKQCTGCGAEQPLVEFPPRGGRCRKCHREYMRGHYQRNRTYYVAKARARQRRVIDETRRFLLEYLQEHPCIDCGTTDPLVLEFDHRDPSEKASSVAVLARSGYPLYRVMQEVAKCDVRCANCHRRRTHMQRGWWGSAWEARESLEADS